MAKKTVNQSGKVTSLRTAVSVNPEAALALLPKLESDFLDAFDASEEVSAEDASRAQGLMFGVEGLLTKAIESANGERTVAVLRARALLGMLEDMVMLDGGAGEETIYEQITQIAALLGEPWAIEQLAVNATRDPGSAQSPRTPKTTAAQPAAQVRGPSAAVIEVESWANSSWLTKSSAVILRPDASPLELISWGIGQIEQAEIVMAVMGSSHCDIVVEPGEVTGPIRLLTEQGLIALKAAADKLFQAHCESVRSMEASHV